MSVDCEKLKDDIKFEFITGTIFTLLVPIMAMSDEGYVKDFEKELKDAQLRLGIIGGPSLKIAQGWYLLGLRNIHKYLLNCRVPPADPQVAQPEVEKKPQTRPMNYQIYTEEDWHAQPSLLEKRDYCLLGVAAGLALTLIPGGQTLIPSALKYAFSFL